MINFEKHPYFEKYTDPVSGIESYILSNKPAKLVHGFYFVNQALSGNGKYLWMYCANPPMPYQTLAVVGTDADKPFIRHFPDAVFEAESPLVEDDGESVYFTCSGAIYRLFIDGSIELLAKMPEEFVDNRYIYRTATHLTKSCDNKYLLFDGHIGNEWHVGTMDLKTREIKIIHTFGFCHNHAQFSPIHPNLFILDQDWWRDEISGRKLTFNFRTWFMNTDHTLLECAMNGKWSEVNSMYCHDFWSADGYLCWQDYEKGAYEMNYDTKEVTHVWKRPLCHVHANYNRSYWCADESPYWWHERPCKLLFYDRYANKDYEIFSAMPKPRYPRMPWHFDPHPQISRDSRFVIGGTTVRGGEPDLFVTPVKNIIKGV